MDVWVIGANSDIARALLERAPSAWRIVAASRDADSLSRFVAERGLGNVAVERLDVADADALVAFPEGRPVPDVVVLAQGVLYAGREAAGRLDEMVVVNFTSCVRIVEALWPRMAERGSGGVVAVTSVAGERGKRTNGLYGATKAALSCYLQQCMQSGAARGLWAVDVRLGYARTKMVADRPDVLSSPLAAEPGEVARAILGAIGRGRSAVRYVRRVWRPIMALVRLIPQGAYDRLSLGEGGTSR